ncbi:hypothetical protein GCM10009430_32410 [Aquimarina litoralis]|uniref:Por secretion system C-terminal sorting domain-containing protein n=1 Tax=Aquimarina litoralis TaxID=584605 RepID=A0ABN1J1P9_9FLAO
MKIAFYTFFAFTLLFTYINSKTKISISDYIEIPPSPSQLPIVLPIEVLGKEGVIEEVQIHLTANQASVGSKLWLLVNNLSYQGKSSIKVNEGNWISLNHKTAEVYDKEMAYGGMAHGAMNTIRLKVPIKGLKKGINKIKFRFNRSDGISIGYRVVRLNILDKNGRNILDKSVFKFDIPKDWKKPIGSSVENGRNLWFNRNNLWNHYDLRDKHGFWYGHKLPVKRKILAKCTDCHTRDGRDLEMFSYSNKSIIERAKFHGLTEKEGKDIAAYIRSLSKKDGVNRYGRPWNPPYQPGPVLKNKPIERWAAGAGLGWVLENDDQMVPYLFGKNISKYSVKDYFDSDKMDDRTTIPLSIQLPDWKHWLPIVHPMDAFSKSNFIHNQGTKPLEATKNFLDWLKTNKENTAEIKKNFIEKHARWYNTFRFFIQDGAKKPRHWRTRFNDSPALKHLTAGIHGEIASTSLARFMAVKNFEIMNEYGLQDKAHWFVLKEDQPGERQWPSIRYNVFEVPPHFTGVSYDGDSNSFEGQTKAAGIYESTNWYNLQFVLNGGNGFVRGVQPSDFNYLNEFIAKNSITSGRDEPVRYFSTINQMYQIRSWSGNLGTKQIGSYHPREKGFRIRNQGPFNFIGIHHQNQMWYGKGNPEKILEPLTKIHPKLDKWVIDALIQQFLVEVRKPKNGLDRWDRNQDDIWDKKELQYMLDRKNIVKIRDLRKVGLYQGHFAAKMYYTITRLKKTKVDCNLLNKLINWCHRAWPNVKQVGNTSIPFGFKGLLDRNCGQENCENNFNLDSNIFRIRTKYNKCVTVNNQNNIVVQRSCTDHSNNEWKLEKVGSSFRLKNIFSGKYLDIINPDNSSFLRVSDTKNSNQLWSITKNKNCSFELRNIKTSKFMSLESEAIKNGIRLEILNKNQISKSPNKEFYLELINQQKSNIIDEENFKIPELKIYPNPAKESLNIAFSNFNEEIRIEIYTINGKLIDTVTSKSKLSRINTGRLKSGIYILKIKGENINETSKFIKL